MVLLTTTHSYSCKVHFIVTEFGIADLFGKSLRERAAALISIAAPQHREGLTAAAKQRCLL